MKIFYFFESKKETRKAINKILGFSMQKWRIKKNLIRKPKTMLQICITNYILCFIQFFIIYALYNFALDNIATFLACFLIVLFCVNTVFLFRYFYYLFMFKEIEGEIRFSEEGIIDTKESGKVVMKPWKKIEMVYIEENIISIFAKSTLYFFPYSETNKEILINAFQKYNLSIPILVQKNSEDNDFKRFFWNVGIYILLFIFSFAFSIGFDIYNENILSKEIEKMILSHEVDDHIYSYQKYGIVEKYVKKYYAEYYQLEDEYLKYRAKEILRHLKPDMFHENRKSLDEFMKSLIIYEQKANAILEKMMNMYNIENALKWIQNEKLEEYYEQIYLSLLFTDDYEKYIQELEEEKEINSLKMKYVKELINFLLETLDDWTIVKNKLYFYHLENANKYNELYNFIMDEKEINNGSFV